MSNKRNEDQRRIKKKRREREAKRRTAIIRDGEKRTVIQQGNTKGYDLEMVRDFLDHLLLELRVQHYENQRLLKALDSTDDFKTAMKVTEEISETLVMKFKNYQQKYQTALIAANVIDSSNATDEECKGVMTAVVKGMLARRDEQIGHMEALQNLFEEALHCAKVPFGVDREGNSIQPQVVHSVRELEDQAFVAHLPNYEELLSLFSDHPFASEPGITSLREHGRSIVIVATNDAYDQPLVLYGADLVEEQRKAGKTNVAVLPIPVTSFSELQFVIAAIAKFVGVPSTDGSPWEDL